MWIILTILIKICFCIFHFGEIKKIKPWIHSYYSMLMSILSPLFRWFSLNLFHFSPCYSLLLSQTNLSVFKWSIIVQMLAGAHPSSNYAAQVNSVLTDFILFEVFPCINPSWSNLPILKRINLSWISFTKFL